MTRPSDVATHGDTADAPTDESSGGVSSGLSFDEEVEAEVAELLGETTPDDEPGR